VRGPIDVFWHPVVLDHDTGAGLFEGGPSALIDVPELHPENAERIANMRSVLERGPIGPWLRWHDGRLAAVEELYTVHPPAYVEEVRAACADGRQFSSTTVASARSWDPILASAGTAIAAGDAVLSGDASISYALVRPPGHHAAPAQVDGYCFFNQCALVAERARASGVARAAVVDWDVHHGNGTQTCFYDRDDVLTISLHMRHGSWGPSHPETGAPDEVGSGTGAGFNVNVELGLGAGDAVYTDAFERVVLPILRQYRPELIIGACGQDASTFDPNGRQNVSMAGFHAIGRCMGEAAAELCDGRLVLVQEGGYARTYAAYCLHATLEGVLGLEPSLADPLAFLPEDAGRWNADLETVRAAHAAYWDLA
jgi:acetoin utilization deacetylase AcuC-like enzyme